MNYLTTRPGQPMGNGYVPRGNGLGTARQPGLLRLALAVRGYPTGRTLQAAQTGALAARGWPQTAVALALLLDKLGHLRSPRWFSWAWTRDGEQVASINVQTQFRDPEIPKPLKWHGLERCRTARRHRMAPVSFRWRATMRWLLSRGSRVFVSVRCPVGAEILQCALSASARKA